MNPILMLYADPAPLHEDVGEVLLTVNRLETQRIAPGWVEVVAPEGPVRCPAGHKLVASACESLVAIYAVETKNRSAANYSRLHVKLPEGT